MYLTIYLALSLSWLCSSVAAKAVFAHYMVGTMTAAEAVTDVQDAVAAGFDAFALNVPSTDSWATDAISYLFSAANNQPSFKLFFSFDMTRFSDPSKFLPLIVQYASNSSYYLQDDRPFVSTFDGGASSYTFGQGSTNGGWNVSFRQPLAAQGINPFFVPDFDDWSGYPTGFFDTFTVVDGAFSWESAWPQVSEGLANVSDTVDRTMLQEAHTAGKVYMMPLSTFQFKHLSGQNWYRRGELNYVQRMGQVLSLQPDLVEVITWNDAGEGHYVGDFWPEQIAGSDIGTYANGYDHKGWLQVLPSFITGYKNGVTDVSKLTPPSGKTAVGVMWYRPLLTSASCSSDSMGKPDGSQNAQDAINFAVILPSSNASNYTINVYSNNNRIGSFPGTVGLNGQTVLGLQAGSGQRVEVVDASNTVVISATGTKDVQADTTGICNYNYEVVGLS